MKFQAPCWCWPYLNRYLKQSCEQSIPYFHKNIRTPIRPIQDKHLISDALFVYQIKKMRIELLKQRKMLTVRSIRYCVLHKQFAE